ncbi:hypothetical protein [Methylotuvimicrobium alcaliphilum]|uniref:Uncharacterized protein n=1 Tax=Methylotuvimicrobium alcaliphilum (strain DSM 19304 / NCIMB 14124 / VKM B-2133 / 20Z) TaxID=1091494 RepID=G4SW95_META2|nr:hypothetical protein [Methylotuvimicrobium alcaliphilum]CCE23010.1 conserved protein of unknown function [Methylotuvimicrobium alcaliphilum 20Z]
MITLEMVELYKKYGGDIDGWARTAVSNEKSVMSDADWYEIDAFVHEYGLVKSGLASARYAEKLHHRMSAAVSDEDALQGLKALVEESRQGAL